MLYLPTSRMKYGACQLKGQIRKNTIKSFVATMALFGVFAIFTMLLPKETTADIEPPLRASGTTTILNIKSDDESIVPVSIAEPQIFIGIEEIMGDLIPVPDAEIINDDEIAVFEHQHIAGAEAGELDFDELENISNDKILIPKNMRERNSEEQIQEYPEIGEFIHYEKEPDFDFEQLKRNVNYPLLALKAGVEGRVTVNVLIDSKGRIIEARILSSDSPLLDSAAIRAVSKVKFLPAVQNGKPVACRLNIPINFKLDAKGN